ncbi:MAG TPA: hypothetical protein H9898_04090 [Candidatus Anaerobiospirillum stercoravium]|nr:hypothetical protein [Candidatus Anaerobiospirillum stercoravium]
MSRLVLISAATAALLLLTGCGLKYDLYLPEDEAQAIEQHPGGAMGSDSSQQPPTDEMQPVAP